MLLVYSSAKADWTIHPRSQKFKLYLTLSNNSDQALANFFEKQAISDIVNHQMGHKMKKIQGNFSLKVPQSFSLQKTILINIWFRKLIIFLLGSNIFSMNNSKFWYNIITFITVINTHCCYDTLQNIIKRKKKWKLEEKKKKKKKKKINVLNMNRIWVLKKKLSIVIILKLKFD